MTKRMTAIVLTLAATICLAGQVTIVNNGQSDYVIAVPAEASERAKVESAALSLQEYVKQSTGCELQIVSENEVKDAPAFYIGKTAKGVQVGLPFDKMHDSFNCQKVIDKDVFLAGCDDSPGLTGPLQHHDREYLSQLEGLNLDIKDQSYRRCYGTLKAVLSFLEDEDIVKILMPGKNGRHIIHHEILAISDERDYFGSPAIPYCYGWNYGDLETTVALNHNNPPFYKHYGGHSFPVAVPASKYSKSHPEYFIMKDGKRQPFYGPAGGNHLCLTNPDVMELMLDEVERQYDFGYRWIQIGPTDGQVPCECDKCMEIAGGDYRERQWLFYRSLAEEASRRWPDLKIVLLAYGLSSEPPKSFDEFPANVIIEHCIWTGDYTDYFKKWDRFKNVPKLSYIYFFGTYHSLLFFPKRSYKFVADNLRALYQNNILGIMKCHWATSLGMEGPVCYVFSKLLENPDADYNQLADDFYRYAYGTAYEPMKRFFSIIDSRLDTPGGHSVINELETRPLNPDVLIPYTFPPTVMSALDHALWEAEIKNDPDPAVRARLALVRREFSYLMCVSKMYALTNAFALTPSPLLITLLEQAEEERDRLLDSWYDENGMMKMEDGFYWPILENSTKTMLRYGGGQTPYTFPIMALNGLASLKQRLKLPLTPKDCISLVARAADKESILTQSDDAFFDSKDGSRISFKSGVAGNDQFYFRCKVKLASGKLNELDESKEKIEVFIQPASIRKSGQYYRVTVSMDGMVKAKLYSVSEHPKKLDLPWSSECRAEIQKDMNGNTWTAVIQMPWKKLSPKSPVPNEDWKCNVRRNGETWSPAPFGTSADDINNWCNLRFPSLDKVLP